MGCGHFELLADRHACARRGLSPAAGRRRMVRHDTGLEGDPDQRQEQRCPLRRCRLEGDVGNGAGGERRCFCVSTIRITSHANTL